jgi:hypothetical protein
MNSAILKLPLAASAAARPLAASSSTTTRMMMMRPFARRMATTAATPKNKVKLPPTNLSPKMKQNLTLAGLSTAALLTFQYQLGSTTDFFEHKFLTSKHPDDLA